MTTPIAGLPTTVPSVRVGTRYVRPGGAGSIARLRERYGVSIDGEWRAPEDDRYRTVLAPATGSPMASIALASESDASRAVGAAARAAQAWARTGPVARSQVLMHIAERLAEHHEELAVLETWETGRIIRDTLTGTVASAIDQFRLQSAVIRVQDERGNLSPAAPAIWRRHDPLGVVVVRLPAERPMLAFALAVAPALAAGNAIVIKPAIRGTVTCCRALDIIAGVVPRGVLNLISGSGAPLRDTLAAHPAVGAVRVLREREDRRRGALFFADLGAQDDALFRSGVEDGTDLARTAMRAPRATRAFVEDGGPRNVVDAIVERIREARIGDPLDTRTDIGPLPDQQRSMTFERDLDRVRRDRLEVLLDGGPVRLDGDLAGGAFVRPAVLSAHSVLWEQELSANLPALVVTRFDDEESLIDAALRESMSRCSVWTRDVPRAVRLVRRVRADRVLVDASDALASVSGFDGVPQGWSDGDSVSDAITAFQRVTTIVVGPNHNGEAS